MEKESCKEKLLFQTKNSQLPEDAVVAMAYVPYQNPVMIYTPDQGFEKGTLFPCLDKPFLGCGGYRR